MVLKKLRWLFVKSYCDGFVKKISLVKSWTVIHNWVPEFQFFVCSFSCCHGVVAAFLGFNVSNIWHTSQDSYTTRKPTHESTRKPTRKPSCDAPPSLPQIKASNESKMWNMLKLHITLIRIEHAYTDRRCAHIRLSWWTCCWLLTQRWWAENYFSIRL